MTLTFDSAVDDVERRYNPRTNWICIDSLWACIGFSLLIDYSVFCMPYDSFLNPPVLHAREDVITSES